jgi:hypothetical protein
VKRLRPAAAVSDVTSCVHAASLKKRAPEGEA